MNYFIVLYPAFLIYLKICVFSATYAFIFQCSSAALPMEHSIMDIYALLQSDYIVILFPCYMYGVVT